MVLFNLPRPSILLCGHDKRPTEIQISTYKVVNRTEFCECSLTAGSFQLDETMVKCSPEVHAEADGKFQKFFAVNKIIFDYLQAERDIELDREVVQALGSLLEVKPEYDWVTLRWHENPDLPDNVIDKQPTSVIVDLASVMGHIITEGEEESFQTETEDRNAQNKFLEFMKYAETWQTFEFISSILGMISMIALVLIAVFCSRIIVSIILSSAIMDKYKFVSPSQTCAKAFMLPPMWLDAEPLQFQPLPPEWGILRHDKQTKSNSTIHGMGLISFDYGNHIGNIIRNL